MTIKTIFWKNNTVVLIDQNALPQIERQVVCSDYRKVITAIKDLTVRGAPAIGVAAAMGVALGALCISTIDAEKFRKQINVICDQIAGARPTVAAEQIQVAT